MAVVDVLRCGCGGGSEVEVEVERDPRFIRVLAWKGEKGWCC